MLAEHPEAYARLRREVLNTLGPNGKVDPDGLRDMKYLRAVLNGKICVPWFTHCDTADGVTRNITLVSECVSSSNLPYACGSVLNGV